MNTPAHTPDEHPRPELRVVAVTEPHAKRHSSLQSRVLVIVCGSVVVGSLLPLRALAQSVGVATTSPEVAPALGLLEVLRSGGSLGVAAICAWWALRKDTQQQKTQDDRIDDQKQMNMQLTQVLSDNTKAMEHHTRALEQLIRIIEQQRTGTVQKAS